MTPGLVLLLTVVAAAVLTGCCVACGARTRARWDAETPADEEFVAELRAMNTELRGDAKMRRTP